MALSTFQRDICRLLADGRRADGDNFVAGGVALGVALETMRVSRDIDVFHDTTEAVARTWDRDRVRLTAAGGRQPRGLSDDRGGVKRGVGVDGSAVRHLPAVSRQP